MKLYVLAVLEVVSHEDGMAVCKTGCTNGHGEDAVAPINENNLVRIDSKLENRILLHWDMLMDSPEYPLYRMIAKIRDERNKALTTLDMNYARRLMPEASSDHVRLMAMHKVRYECPFVTDELRHASADWLRKHEYSRMDGTPLLPAGELPL
jgi:hypothetical protein